MQPDGDILTDPDDYILDLSSNTPESTAREGEIGAKGGGDGTGRPFLSIHFKCCKVYSRIYKNTAGDAYVGHCPRCARALRVPIGPGGSSKRTFVAE